MRNYIIVDSFLDKKEDLKNYFCFNKNEDKSLKDNYLL